MERRPVDGWRERGVREGDIKKVERQKRGKNSGQRGDKVHIKREFSSTQGKMLRKRKLIAFLHWAPIVQFHINLALTTLMPNKYRCSRGVSLYNNHEQYTMW